MATANIVNTILGANSLDSVEYNSGRTAAVVGQSTGPDNGCDLVQAADPEIAACRLKVFIPVGIQQGCQGARSPTGLDIEDKIPYHQDLAGGNAQPMGSP
jgi:hypothetical protein